MDVQALGTIASSGNMAYKTPRKSWLRHINQQHIRRCSNISGSSAIVMISLELIREREPFEHNFYCKVTGLSVRESDGLPFVEIESNFQSSSEPRFYTEFINLNSLVLKLATELLQFQLAQTVLYFQNLNIKPSDKSKQKKSLKVKCDHELFHTYFTKEIPIEI